MNTNNLDNTLADLSSSTITVPAHITSVLENKDTIIINELLEIQHDTTNIDFRTISDWASHLTENLLFGSGYVCIKCDEELTEKQLRLLYMFIGKGLGNLNTSYGNLFDVVDQGMDHKKEAVPVSKTSAETSFHTDSTAKNYFPDIIGLLCISPAYSGGDSLIGSATQLYYHLKRDYPELLSVLKTPIIRDVITPGTDQDIDQILQNSFPVFEENNKSITFRYMRYWIESAHIKTGKVLPNKLKEAMDEIDRFFSSEENILQFQLNAGDILYMNNRFLCHNRTAFEDRADLNIRRKLVRTWINV
jgi:hypothetical protein